MNLSSYEPQKLFMILNEFWGAFWWGKTFLSANTQPLNFWGLLYIVGKIKFELLPTLLGTNISYLGKGKSWTQKCRLTQGRCDRFPGGYFMIRNGFQLQASGAVVGRWSQIVSTLIFRKGNVPPKWPGMNSGWGSLRPSCREFIQSPWRKRTTNNSSIALFRVLVL